MQNVVEFGTRFFVVGNSIVRSVLLPFSFSSLFFSPLNCFNWIRFEAQVGASGSSLRARTQSTHVHGGALNECGAWVLESIVLCVIRRK